MRPRERGGLLRETAERGERRRDDGPHDASGTERRVTEKERQRGVQHLQVVGLQDLPGLVQCREFRSGLHLIGTPHELTTDLSLQGSLAGLLIGPSERGERRQMPGIGEQTLLRQGHHLVRMAKPTLQFEKEIQKNILLLAAAPTYITNMVHGWGYQAGCSTVVLAHEGHLAFE